jgi:hypothetical protein
MSQDRDDIENANALYPEPERCPGGVCEPERCFCDPCEDCGVIHDGLCDQWERNRLKLMRAEMFGLV